MTDEDANISLDNNKSNDNITQQKTNTIISPRESISITSQSPSDVISNNSHDRLVGGVNVRSIQVSTVHPENLTTSQALSSSQQSKSDVSPKEYLMTQVSPEVPPPAYSNEFEKDRTRIERIDDSHRIQMPEDANKAQEIKDKLQTDRQIRMVSLYSQQIVLEAFLITFGVFIALEIFTFQSKWDFSSWGPFLYATLWVLIFAFIFGWFLPFDHGYNIVISSIAALLFSAYIIYDTYMLAKRVSPEEYVLAAVDLYLDIINLFVAIFAILLGACDSS
ncbi:8646_t:CDS:2 [Cetraspora pellucida]|uniref:8646_t:CDS:1 n=1 Tax=Cetraspora pellucida TaxID=1433469 RepID=A0A9N9DTE3_9GLOM|nr:8646_t:CDS:2 [Cetraspora pellucida]